MIAKASIIQVALRGHSTAGTSFSRSSSIFDLSGVKGVARGVDRAHGIGPSSWE